METTVRMHCHDALFAHHDKDYKCLASFPWGKLRSLLLELLP